MLSNLHSRYDFTFGGFHASNYTALSIEQDGEFIKVSCVDPNYLGDEELEKQNTTSYSFAKDGDMIYVSSGGNNSEYIIASKKDAYPYVECDEESKENTENVENADVFQLSEEQLVKQITQALSDMISPDVEYTDPFREEASVAIYTPGQGLYMDTTMASNIEELRAIDIFPYVSSPEPSELLEFAIDGGFYIVEKLPDYCMAPEDAGIYAKVDKNEEGRFEYVTIHYVGFMKESEETITSFKMKFWWDENENLTLRFIDLSDCGA